MSLCGQRVERDPERAPDDPKAAVRASVADALAATEPPLYIKAKEIARELGLHSSHVGGILGVWAKQDDAPFEIEPWGGRSHDTLWVIER